MLEDLVLRLALFVGLFVVENLALGYVERFGVAIVFLIEAALVTSVAGAADLFDLEKEHILIAVGIPAFDFLGVAAGFAFEPELLTGAAPVVHEAGLEGFLEGFAIHPREHEDPAARGVSFRGFLGDDGDESVGGKFEVEFHCCKVGLRGE